MAIKINFDSANVPEEPTLILANRRGNKIGKINAQNIVIKDDMMNGAEISFSVNKFLNGEQDYLWDEIKDYKLVWCKEADLWFQMAVDIEEELNPVKNISCVQLAQAELSQIVLYNVEINTEDDIAREDYDKDNPTVLYNENIHSSSLLHRITEKAPHYEIVHVDATIAGIQRTFSFDGTSIYDACSEIAEEIGCLFVFHSDSNVDGSIRRGISVYDLQTYCTSCGERGHFTHTCSKCGSTELIEGYGEDTTIFITADELGKDIKFTSDTDSQKNCFKLEGGDDLMTAAIRSCNPNGTDYIWYIPDYIKEDMSDELVQKIEAYDNLYEYYQKEYPTVIGADLLNKYNALINKYKTIKTDLTNLTSPIVGFSNLMTAYYQNIDFALYLQSEMMPTVELLHTTAEQEIAKLNATSLSPVAVTSTKSLSEATASSAVLSVAKCLVNPNYQVKISSSSLSGATWTGKFSIENYSDEEDKATSDNITVTITANYENYVNQKLQKALSQNKQDNVDITGLFAKDLDGFKSEIKKYCLDSLNSFYDMCQTCIDVLTEQGVPSGQTWGEENLYNKLYLPYYNKLKAIEEEQAIRENEIYIITGKYDNTIVLIDGLQSILDRERNAIQKTLNFENYLGSDLWLEFCAYKREDKYSNSNYVSDGLNNAELFDKALEFIDKAQKELYTSAELQHSISASLINLLVIPKFKVLTEYFSTGNWLRILVDNEIYKLRLISYEVDYSNLEDISVEFSDVMKTADGYSDQQSLMQAMSGMATSYGYTQHQAEQGSKSKKTIANWTEKGLDVTNNKIINGASNQTQVWDEHGILCRQYNDVLDEYDDCQLKIINSTLAVTDDNWKHVKTAIGKFYYIDPETNEIKYSYGVNGETIVGKLLLGEQLGIYNESGSLTFDNKGLNITNSKNTFNVNPNANNLLTISQTINGNTENIFYVDENGTLHIKGDGSALDITANNSVSGLSTQITQNSDNISLIANKNTSGTVLSLKSDAVKIAWNNISQYVQFDTVSSLAGLSIYNPSSNRVLRLDNSGLKINNSSGNDLMNLNTTGLDLYGQYDGDNSTYKLMSLNSRGTSYYYKKDDHNNPKEVGMIGTGSWNDHPNYRSLVFRLKHDAGCMCWSYENTTTQTYDVQLVYHSTNEVAKQGLHFYSVAYADNKLYVNDHLYINDNVRTKEYSDGNAGLFSETNEVFMTGKTARMAAIKNNNGTISNLTYIETTATGINCKGDLNMGNYSVNSNSDIRLKTNITDTEIDALDLLNKVELKSFDWIEDNRHENIGVIAQQLQEIIPDLVNEDSLTTKLSVQPMKFIPYLIKAVQELSVMIMPETVPTESTDILSKKTIQTKQNKKKNEYTIDEKMAFVEKVKPITEEAPEKRTEIKTISLPMN